MPSIQMAFHLLQFCNFQDNFPAVVAPLKNSMSVGDRDQRIFFDGWQRNMPCNQQISDLLQRTRTANIIHR